MPVKGENPFPTASPAVAHIEYIMLNPALLLSQAKEVVGFVPAALELQCMEPEVRFHAAFALVAWLPLLRDDGLASTVLANIERWLDEDPTLLGVELRFDHVRVREEVARAESGDRRLALLALENLLSGVVYGLPLCLVPWVKQCAQQQEGEDPTPRLAHLVEARLDALVRRVVGVTCG